ncbi:hypothetical protein FRC09_001922 [Ceratobasidium sp. 395]|nr:hypothetical protein FRC09_001922 [Ceratobasidium sp. 395]
MPVGGVLGQSPIRIDDTNVFGSSNPGGIQFGGTGWDNYNPGHAQVRYNQSYTVTNTPDATIVLFFRGKSIKYCGDRDPKGGSATVRIDGQTSTNVDVRAPPSGFMFQQVLWTSLALDSNDHQLVISNVGARLNPEQGVMGLDFFEIVPNDGSNSVAPMNFGPGATSVSKNAILIDDSEGSISYSGSGWQTKNSVLDSSIYFQGSSHTTQNPGDSATYRFVGTDIWYFTDYAPNNAVVSVSIDGGTSETVNTAAGSQTLARTQWMAWGKNGLSDAPHTITVAHAGSAGTAASLDFLKYVPSSGAGAAASLSSASVAATQSSTSNDNSKSTPVGAIVGGSVGGFAVILLAILVVLFLARRNKKDKQSQARVAGPADMNNAKASWTSPPTSPRPSMLGYGMNGANTQSYGQYPINGATSTRSHGLSGYSGYPEVQP